MQIYMSIIKKRDDIKMNRTPEETVKLAECGEVKLKTTKPQEVVYGVHKGSYQKLGEVFVKLAQWIEENGYAIVGPSVTICYNDPHTTPEEELISECPFPVKKKE
jgi:effector-binding domain-containing protein